MKKAIALPPSLLLCVLGVLAVQIKKRSLTHTILSSYSQFLAKIGNSTSAKKPGIVPLPKHYRPDFRLDESVDPFFR